MKGISKYYQDTKEVLINCSDRIHCKDLSFAMSFVSLGRSIFHKDLIRKTREFESRFIIT